MEVPRFETLPILTPPSHIMHCLLSVRPVYIRTQHDPVLVHELIFDLNTPVLIHIDAFYKAPQRVAVKLF